jgi:GT2 family glycosyltransferase/glycosyltransferase involved in cell wall biosynthesis
VSERGSFFAPPGSRREYALEQLLRGLRLWRARGSRALLASVARRLRRGDISRSWRPSLGPRSLPVATTYDLVCFPVIDWGFRFQRPQQLLRRFASQGHRVFYLRTRCRPWSLRPRLERIAPRIYEVQLPGPFSLDVHRDVPDQATLEGFMTALEELRWRHGVEQAVSLVQLPFWGRLALEARQRFGWRVVYDCLDDHTAFSVRSPGTPELEEELFRRCDLAVASSRALLERAAGLAPRTLLLPNAADFEHFHAAPRSDPLPALPSPIVGYFGAIAEWFDVELVRSAAVARRDWQFVLIGDTTGADVAPLRALSNVQLLGERPYDALPAYLHRFDVACIPFRRTALTLAASPVKFYEYLSAGKPVVAVSLPELEPHRDLFYPLDSLADFLPQLAAALRPEPAERGQARIAFARQNDWEQRRASLAQSICDMHGRVVVVVVSYNNLEYLQLCLGSLWSRTQHPDLKVIVVDNGSEPPVVEYLRRSARREPRLQVIVNGENLGFARANNIGIAAAGPCQALVLLNDDTLVTHGWLPRLLRHLERPDVGLVGPVTNFCGNEARIDARYDSLESLESFARAQGHKRAGRHFEIAMLAMYCVALRKAVFDAVGPLDERYGVGMFEDDDYSLRVKERGLKVVCAEDAFVHHWGRASFSRMDDGAYRRLFEENRRRFEEKWGRPWSPHVGRSD